MALSEYRRKRRFDQTPEPAGRRHRSTTGNLFVVQKHAATRLHYDFRLELDGVLKSWAVPKGPSLDPNERRLAVEVEDHPIEYGDFEGVIPEGEYGGGTVIVWDRGTWEAVGDAAEGYRQGKLKFVLRGKKLRGGWLLVRMPRRGGERSANWLLIKERDEYARPVDEYEVTREEPDSVKSRRSLDKVARSPRVWTSNRAVPAEDGKTHSSSQRQKARKDRKDKPPRQKGKPALTPTDARTPATTMLDPQALVGARRAKPPRWIEPQLAMLSREPPEGDRWFHEIKFDGYRILAYVEKQTRLWSRNQQDWTAMFSRVAAELNKLAVKQAWLDGELVALAPNGISSFQLLQNAMRDGRASALVYQVFDLLYLDGFDLRGVALEQRKALLTGLLAPLDPAGPIRFTDHLVGQGKQVFEQVCRLGLEGIVSKRRDRPYMAGRGTDWLKTKCVFRDEFVVGGFTEPAGSGKGLGSLLVGYYDHGGKLIYAGRVGTGFTDALLNELRARLDKLEVPESPFANLDARSAAKHTHWVKPELVAQVEYSQWTRDGRLRHPSFQGLREDKPAQQVRRDAAHGAAGRRSGKATTMSNEAVTSGNVAAHNIVAGIEITHPDRVLYPQQGITKLGLAQYYAKAADWMLPYLDGRPLTLVRCPGGHREKCFYQKHFGRGAPEALRTISIEERSKVGQYAVVDNVEALVSLVQFGVLEIHIWPAREDALQSPDLVVFDLDPDPSVDWPEVIRAARQMRKLLESLGLESFVKTTGGEGLHLVSPIKRRHQWPVVKQFARQVAERMAAEAPSRYTTNMSKAARGGKIFIDYLRNDRGATFVCPFSTRARPGAPVSTPLAWDELSPAIRSDHFTVENLPARLTGLKHDPWADFFKLRQSLTARALEQAARGA
jgi:bifunctional non-homologous end joining protein LigD